MVTLLDLIFRQIALCPLDLAEDVKIDQSESRVREVADGMVSWQRDILNADKSFHLRELA